MKYILFIRYFYIVPKFFVYCFKFSEFHFNG